MSSEIPCYTEAVLTNRIKTRQATARGKQWAEGNRCPSKYSCYFHGENSIGNSPNGVIRLHVLLAFFWYLDKTRMVNRHLHSQTETPQDSWAVCCSWDMVQVHGQEGCCTKPPSDLCSLWASAMSCCSLDEPVCCPLLEHRYSCRQECKLPVCLCLGDLHNLLLHSLFPLRFQKQAELLTICTQETAAALRLCHPLHTDLGCPSSFQFFVLLGLQHTSTRQKHGRFKKLLKKESPQLKDQTPNQSNLFG